ESTLRLDQPGLGEIASRLRFLRAEGWPEAVDLTESHCRGFDIKLSRLRQVCLFVEVIHGKQRGRTFAGGGCKNRWIGEGEAAIVKIIACRLDDLSANPQDRGLTGRAQPKMAMLHEEIDTMLFRRDGVRVVRVDALHNLRVSHVHLVTAGSAFVGAH